MSELDFVSGLDFVSELEELAAGVLLLDSEPVFEPVFVSDFVGAPLSDAGLPLSEAGLPPPFA